MRFLRQGTATTVPIGPYLSSTDGFTAKTALTTSPEVSKDGAVFVARSDATAITHDADGWYQVTFDAVDTDTAGNFLVKDVVATALPVWMEFVVLPENIYDSLVAGTDLIDTELSDIQERLPGALVGGRMDSAVGFMADEVLTNEAIENDAISDVKVASDVTIAAVTGKVTPIDVDGLTFESTMEILLAVLAGITDPLGGTVAFKKRNGVTTKITITYGAADGERTNSVLS